MKINIKYYEEAIKEIVDLSEFIRKDMKRFKKFFTDIEDKVRRRNIQIENLRETIKQLTEGPDELKK